VSRKIAQFEDAIRRSVGFNRIVPVSLTERFVSLTRIEAFCTLVVQVDHDTFQLHQSRKIIAAVVQTTRACGPILDGTATFFSNNNAGFWVRGDLVDVGRGGKVCAAEYQVLLVLYRRLVWPVSSDSADIWRIGRN
jgi:hypothetical protein